MMASNVEQTNLGLENLFNSAKKLYSQSNETEGDGNINTSDNSGDYQKIVSQSRDASVAIANSAAAHSKSLGDSNRKLSQETKVSEQTPVLSKLRNFMKRSKSKDVKEILTPENANPEIRSEREGLNGVTDFYNPVEHSRQEISKNYALSKTLNPDKLTEIINNSIKAVVENLANDVNPPFWEQEKEKDQKKNVAPFDSTFSNDTYSQRKKTSNSKEKVANSTQYSQQAVSSIIRPNVSNNISSIYANNNSSSARNSKRSYDSQQKSSPRQSPTRCTPLSKSVTSSVICHQSVSNYKQTICPYLKQKQDKPAKLCSKPCKKPCKLLKTDNRRMTGNVNIYICSEGNDGGNKKKKKSESTCNSTTVTNASCTCSSSDVCACRSNTSSKTIRNLMTKTKNKSTTEDITLKCACGKLPLDCECISVRPKNLDTEALCLCETSSLNPTTSVETCRDTVDYNLQTLKTSDSSPHGDYCVNKVRSRSSSRYEPCCTRQNFDTLHRVTGVENNSRTYVGKSKFTKCNSGRGDAVQECSCCDTFSDYSEGKANLCNCCDAKLANPERYVMRDIGNRSKPRENVVCNCCKHDNESLYSNEKRNEDVDQSTVCCKNKKMNKPRIEPQKKDYCKKPCSPSRSTARDNNSPQRWSDSNFCIMEENEECDATSCKFHTESSSQKASRTPYRRESNINEEHRSIEVNEKRDDAKSVASNGRPASQSVATRMSIAEVVKSLSNADKSTSSNYLSFTSPSSPPLPSASKSKESRKSSLKWPFSKAKSLISGKSTSAESKANKSATDASKSQANVAPLELVKSENVPSEIVTEKTVNGSNSATVSKSITGEKSSSVAEKISSEGGALITIKSSTNGEERSKELIIENNKTKLSSSKLGSLIADRKNSLQSATNETARSYEDNQSNGTCQCGATDADMCTCQYPHCTCCNRPQEYCRCNGASDRTEEQSPNVCERKKQLCCCSEDSNQKKTRCTLPENNGFRVCTLCCKPEKNCCCNLGEKTLRRSRTPSNAWNKKNADSYESIGRKSQICVYCERPREKCACRAPVKKCSYCGMPVDVCNCQDVETTCNVCSYDENTCQCSGRVIDNPDGGDQSICVTAWKPRREIRKYFSRNPGERDNPDCPCCETVRPYGSDELPYQRLSVFSDVMTELQQKMNEVPSCNRCEKIPCCCCVPESKSYSSPANESRLCNAKQKKSRSRSPPCRHCLGSNPCECGGQKSPSYQICNHCRTTPCRCRRSRSTQRKPQAKCYYCKNSPCRCESNKTTNPKGCRCSGSSPRTQEQGTSLVPNKIPGRNSPSSRPRSCRCRCGSSSCESPLRGQERR